MCQCLFYPQILEVFLLQLPITKPHLHLVHKFDDASCFEIHHLLHLLIFFTITLHHPQQEISNHPTFIDYGHLLILDNGLAEGSHFFVQRVGVTHHRDMFICETRSQLIGLQVDSVFVYIALYALEVLTHHLYYFIFFLIFHEVKDSGFALLNSTQKLRFFYSISLHRRKLLFLFCALLLQLIKEAFFFADDLEYGLFPQNQIPQHLLRFIHFSFFGLSNGFQFYYIGFLLRALLLVIKANNSFSHSLKKIVFFKFILPFFGLNHLPKSGNGLIKILIVLKQSLFLLDLFMKQYCLKKTLQILPFKQKNIPRLLLQNKVVFKYTEQILKRRRNAFQTSRNFRFSERASFVLKTKQRLLNLRQFCDPPLALDWRYFHIALINQDVIFRLSKWQYPSHLFIFL